MRVMVFSALPLGAAAAVINLVVLARRASQRRQEHRLVMRRLHAYCQPQATL
jgi:hypothetical protein